MKLACHFPPISVRRTMPWFMAVCLFVLLAFNTWAAQSVPTSATAIQAVPPNLSKRELPLMMMLAASRDHTLFGPMYTDYEDLSGSGQVDPTFRSAFKYYGYFDPTKCYKYDATGQVFEPVQFVKADGCKSASDSARWHGNFMNWATMTRIDVVRKMLYGGYRSTDQVNNTVLQLAQLGTDAHAFAKYYYGADIDQYTPFSTETLKDAEGHYVGLTMCTMSTTPAATGGLPIMRMAKGNYTLWSTMAKRVCQWRPAEVLSSDANKDYWFGDKVVAYFKRDAANPGMLQNMPEHGRIAPIAVTAIAANSDLPPGIGSDGVTLRVHACVAGLRGQEACKAFTYRDAQNNLQTSYKPVGVLQEYGYADTSTDPARAEFGLISGSYDNNLSGGILRKPMGNLNDEINADGTFCHWVNKAGCQVGLIKSFDMFRLYRSGSTAYITEPSFRWVLPSDVISGQFPSWGNPMGELLVEALSYFAGKGASSSSTAKGYAIDDALGLPRPAWSGTDPFNDQTVVPGSSGKTRGSLYGKSLCRPLGALMVSSSAVTNDRDDVGNFLNLPNREGQSLAAFTDVVGSKEGINGTSRSVANVAGGYGDDCTAKSVTSLSSVSGICPEAPATLGSYLSAGAAFYAKTHAVREVSSTQTLPTDLPPYALRVKTMAAAMGGGVARIEITRPSDGAKIYITPESIWDVRSKQADTSVPAWMPAAMLTIKLINATSNAAGQTIAASYVVTWNDAQFGGDYDMDIVGYIAYQIDGDQVHVTTDILNVDGGLPGSHGFSIAGAVSPARYITHGSHGIQFGECQPGLTTQSKRQFNLRCAFADEGMPKTNPPAWNTYDAWVWPSTFDGSNVVFAPPPGQYLPATSVTTAVTKTFTFDTHYSGSVLKDPLWYAAKYGSFDTGETQFQLNAPATAAPDASANAEGYFIARDPSKLVEGLKKELDGMLAMNVNAAPAISTSQLLDGTLKYVAEFDAHAYTGNVSAYAWSGQGYQETAAWKAGKSLANVAPSDRRILTNVGATGALFTVNALEQDGEPYATIRTALNADGPTDSWKDLVEYVRGQAATQDLRPRPSDNLMGPVVNAAPWVQKGVAARQTDAELPSGWPSYREFVTQRSTASLLWVSSFDSMLHAFDAKTGVAVMSYLPSPLFAGLRQSDKDTTKRLMATMDGSPFTADIYSPAQGWRTYLFSSLGRGGQAVFALDVTNPAALKTAQPSQVFKWMFTSQDDSDLGYVLGDPVVHRGSGQVSNVVLLNNQRHALMVPNGYGASSGQAALFLLDVGGPGDSGWVANTNYIKLLAGASGDNNGLMGATWVDIDNNGTADWIYATDLRGHLWKFDVSSSNPSNWSVAFGGHPLFQALSNVQSDGQGTPLPITTAPVVSFPGLGGVMVSFGTGQAIHEGDFPNTSLQQRFYSIWDRGNFQLQVESGDTYHRPLPTHQTLLSRKLVRSASGAVSLADPSAQLDWSTQDGWYLDFPVPPSHAAGQTGTGEMVLTTPVARSGALIFTTVWPKDSTEALCYNDPNYSLYVINATQGVAIKTVLTATDVVDPMAVKIDHYKIAVVLDSKKGGNNTPYVIQTGTKDIHVTLPARIGRVQWRVIPGLKTQ